LIGIYDLCIESFPFFLVITDMFTYPDIPVKAEYQVNARRKRAKVGFQPADKYWGN